MIRSADGPMGVRWGDLYHVSHVCHGLTPMRWMWLQWVTSVMVA